MERIRPRPSVRTGHPSYSAFAIRSDEGLGVDLVNRLASQREPSSREHTYCTVALALPLHDPALPRVLSYRSMQGAVLPASGQLKSSLHP